MEDDQVGLVLVTPVFSLVPGQQGLTEEITAGAKMLPIHRTTPFCYGT